MPNTNDIPNIKVIYAIVCKVNNRAYVGCTKELKHRVTSHFKLLSEGKHHCAALQLEYMFFGEENFDIVIIHHLQKWYSVNDSLLEAYYISKVLHPYNTYSPSYNKGFEKTITPNLNYNFFTLTTALTA